MSVFRKNPPAEGPLPPDFLRRVDLRPGAIQRMTADMTVVPPEVEPAPDEAVYRLQAAVTSISSLAADELDSVERKVAEVRDMTNHRAGVLIDAINEHEHKAGNIIAAARLMQRALDDLQKQLRAALDPRPLFDPPVKGDNTESGNDAKEDPDEKDDGVHDPQDSGKPDERRNSDDDRSTVVPPVQPPPESTRI